MRRGYGYATIARNDAEQVVVKFGRGMFEQGEHLRKLGDKICPKLLGLSERGYFMELLSEPEELELANAQDMLLKMCGKLINNVWHVEVPGSFSWRSRLVSWGLSEHRVNLRDIVETLYGYRESQPRLIHGDPTLANVLYRGQDLVIADPLQPTDKIPSLVEVDIAKLAQSVVGWEHFAHGWPRYGAGLVNALKDGLQYFNGYTPNYPEEAGRQHQRILFWLMVHLYRVIPYVGSTSRAGKWAAKLAMHLKENVDFTNGAKGIDLCSTLTTLTELSPTRALRSTPRIKR